MQVYKEIYLHISIEIYLQVCTAPSRNAACHDSSISCAVLHITMAPHRAADSCMSDSQAQRGRASVRSVLLFSSPLRVRARCYQLCVRARARRTRVCKRESVCVLGATSKPPWVPCRDCGRRAAARVAFTSTTSSTAAVITRSRSRPRSRMVTAAIRDGHGYGYGRSRLWSRLRSWTGTATIMDARSRSRASGRSASPHAPRPSLLLFRPHPPAPPLPPSRPPVPSLSLVPT